MAGNIKGLTVEIGGDTTKLGQALENVNKKSRDLSSELGQVNRLLKMDPGNTELVAQKQKILAEAIENTKKKLETLKKAEQQAQEQFERGEISEQQYRALQREIVATEQKIKGYEKAAEQVADGNDKIAETADEAAESSGKLGEVLKSAASKGLQAVAGAATAALAGLVASAEATREYRTEMGKLDAAFTASGHTSETAYAAYKELVGIIGETDQSVEAAQQIALLADSEKDVAAWAEQAAAVVGTFGDALQPETFFEAANETMKLNEATGAYVQMLEGTGMNVEEFNKGLQACNTEAEKQAYMLDITEQALGAAGEAYKANNEEVIRANKANEDWMKSLAGVGKAVEPVLSDIKIMGAELLDGLVPGVQAAADAFRGMMGGEEGAAEAFGQSLTGLATQLLNKVTELAPTIMQVATSLITSLVTSLIGMLPQLVTTGITLFTTLLEGLTQAIPLIVTAITEVIPQLVSALVAGIPLLIEGAVQLFMAIVQALPVISLALVEAMPQLIMGIVNGLLQGVTIVGSAALKLGATLVTNVINQAKTLPSKIWTAIKGALDKVTTWGTQLATKAQTAATNMVNKAINVIKNIPTKVWSSIKGAIDKVTTWGSQMKTKATTAANNVVSTITTKLSQLPGKVLSIGGDLVKGLWNGVNNKLSWLKGKISSFTQSVLSSIKDFFGVHSPARSSGNLKTTDWIGEMLNEGLAVGLLGSASTPVKAMQKVTGAVLGAAAKAELGGMGMERSLEANFGAAVPDLNNKLDKILTAIEAGHVLLLDGDALVGGTVNKFDKALGQRRALVVRGAI